MAIELPPAEAPTAALGGRELIPAVRLGGRRKAAVLMAALGAERAAEIMRHLREEEIESLSLELTKLGAIEEHTTEAILTELAAAAGTGGLGDVAGGIEFAREVLEQALGAERAEELLARLSTVTETRSF